MTEALHSSNKLRADPSSQPTLLEESVGSGFSNKFLKGLGKMTLVTSGHGANSSLPVSHVKHDLEEIWLVFFNEYPRSSTSK